MADGVAADGRVDLGDDLPLVEGTGCGRRRRRVESAGGGVSPSRPTATRPETSGVPEAVAWSRLSAASNAPPPGARSNTGKGHQRFSWHCSRRWCGVRSFGATRARSGPDASTAFPLPLFQAFAWERGQRTDHARERVCRSRWCRSCPRPRSTAGIASTHRWPGSSPLLRTRVSIQGGSRPVGLSRLDLRSGLVDDLGLCPIFVR